MHERVKVKEPPRSGLPRNFRFHLRYGHELIGWTDSYEDANDWLMGFGPGTDAGIEDRRAWVPKQLTREPRR